MTEPLLSEKYIPILNDLKTALGDGSEWVNRRLPVRPDGSIGTTAFLKLKELGLAAGFVESYSYHQVMECLEETAGCENFRDWELMPGRTFEEVRTLIDKTIASLAVEQENSKKR